MTQEKNKIVILKMVTGEEVIGRVVKMPTSELQGYEIEYCRSLQIGMTAPGQLGVSTMPWLAGNQDIAVFVPMMHVMTSYTPSDNMEKSYLSQITGVDLSATKIQLNG